MDVTERDDATADDAAAFVAKWRGAWPEWTLVERFVPASQRALVDAWQALQFEWQEAAWRGDDARPGEAKLRWWMDELDGWSKGVRRHPLGRVLQRQGAPWRELVPTLAALIETRERPRDAAAAWATMTSVAQALASIETGLMHGASDPRVVAACWLHARLARHPDSAVPTATATDADARHGWTDALRADWPSAKRLTPSRGIEASLARARLARGDASTPLPPLAALWAGWRGARG